MQPPVPILRSFDEAKTKAFFIDFLGFEIDFEHRFVPQSPLYMGVRQGACELHLSEHFGDGTLGTVLRIAVPDVHDLCRRLNRKTYQNARPGVQRQDWGWDKMPVSDPSGNKLIFATPNG